MSFSPSFRSRGKKILASGWGTLTSHRIEVPTRDGRPVELTREIYDHGNAAAILLLEPTRKLITLVRQFRLAPELNGDPGHLLEVCAGLLEGDTPDHCARKEAVEETGIAPRELIPAFTLYASPGSLTEKTHCFIGLYSEADHVGSGGGLAEEGEDIEIVEIAFEAALSLAHNGAIVDAKTVALIQYAALEGMLSRPAG